MNTSAGPVDVSSLGTLFFDPNDPTASTTDAGELALLAFLGYIAGGPSFDIPEGAPLDSFAVPEPASISGFGLAQLALLVSKRRRRKPGRQMGAA